MPAASDLGLFRRLAVEARPYWPHIAGVFLLSLPSTLLALLTPLPLKIAVDSVIGNQPLPRLVGQLLATLAGSKAAILALAAALTVLIAVAGQAQDLASALLRAYTGERLVLAFRAKLFWHVQRLSLLYHDHRGIADSSYRILYDAPAIQWIAVDGILPLLSAVLTVAAMLFIIARLDWQLAIVALTVSPALFAISHLYRGLLRDQWRGVKNIESDVLSVMQEVLSGLRVVRAFGQERREQERFVARSSAGMRARLRLIVLESSFALLVTLGTAAGTAIVLWVGVRHVLAGTLTLGNLLVVMGYLGQLYLPLKAISNKAADVQASLASAERAFALLDQEPDVAEAPDALPLGRASGAVAFHHVGFAYPAGRRVLDDIDFVVRPGDRVGISGTTGSGKTTLISLLTRFFDPTEGEVRLDGSDLRTYRVGDLRRQFAIVLQEPVLFSSSIAENIAYGRPEASMDDIVAAARAADAHDFIMCLPDTYETQVGERGMRLSGGERQRLSLARAFLKDAPILTLDEPTSSVDVTTETAIMAALERLMAGRTTFLIAHRLSTLAGCNLRLTIEHGHLAAAERLDEADATGHAVGLPAGILEGERLGGSV
jgi:ATP-binding cassette, subfamily B, bacterial